MTAAQASTQGKQRFASDTQIDIEDVADPHTLEDDTREPIGTKIKRHWKFLAIAVPIGVAAIAILIGYTWHLVPTILGNRYVQLAGAVAAIAGGSAYAGAQWRLGWIRRQDELVLRTPNGPVRFEGRVKQTAAGSLVFMPIKGYRWCNTTPVYYTIEEFGRELNESWPKQGYDPDDPAEIELHPKVSSARDTDLGTVIEQSTGDPPVKVDRFARETVLYATEPEYIEEDVAEDLRRELIRIREERDELDERLDDAKRRLEQAKAIGAMSPEEFLESHQEFAMELIAVARGRSRPSSGDEETDPARDLGTSTGSSYDFSGVEEELTSDD
ncbi:hypothetical protein [Halobiforma nitratireducens]|uniref:Uncharacterized protein n=1 Tax=Halobiforma nitratireducens JCM 10879 TaxID=1227454 RepID=M0MKG4_9EURY|nr:hypothetical protein [Halobiforma nitratireducens]EMA45229.1 hypothetical protein C446_02447 [Halobiforma nitratireducens JCM 10879]